MDKSLLRLFQVCSFLHLQSTSCIDGKLLIGTVLVGLTDEARILFGNISFIVVGGVNA